MYSIVTTPNKVLLDTAKPVAKFDGKLKTILKEMEKTLLATVDPIGVGLAAPQVGLSLRIFQIHPSETSKVMSFINPVFESTSEEEEVPHLLGRNEKPNKPKSSKNKLLEGCLSIPNIWGNVARKKEATLTWQDEEGKRHTEIFTGFPAIIVQHEMDHLNGILFTKHVMEQGEKLYKSHKDEKNDDIFDEIKI